MEVRNGLARAIGELPESRRAADVERALGIDRPLAWRIFRTATASDAAQTIQYLPTTNQLLRVLGLARRRGVRLETIHAIEASLARFDEAVHAAAGDRAALGTLLSSHIKQGMSPLELRVRRDAFRSNAHLWGNQCRTLAFLAALRPNAEGTALDSITARGWVDLHTSRPQASTVLFSRFQLRHDDDWEGPETVEAVETHVGSLEIVHGFGSHGDSELITLDKADGRQETHVRLPGVGREGRVTLFLRQRIDGTFAMTECARMLHVVCTPAEALVFDLLVPAGWADPERTEALVYTRPHDVSRTIERRSEDLATCYDEPVFVPGVENVSHLPEVPRWPELVGHLLREREWTGTKFDLIRLRVAYPMLHSGIVLEASPHRD